MSQNLDSNNISPNDSNFAKVDAICLSFQFHLPEPALEAQQMRWQAVNHPDTDPQVLNLIAEKGNCALASRVADHPRTLPFTMNQLAYHDSYEVRAALADNHNISLELQWQLAEDEHPDVRFAIAQAYHIDQSVLATLLEDENPFVANRARLTLQRRNSAMTRATKLPLNTAGIANAKRKRASG